MKNTNLFQPATDRYEITKPLPLKDQETSLTRPRGSDWRLDTSEPTVVRLLRRKGYDPVDDDGVGNSVVFDLPANAITFRSRSALQNSHQTKNLPNRATSAGKGAPIPSKVGEESELDGEIEDADDPSVALAETEPRKGPKSSKVGKRDEDLDSEAEPARTAK